MNFEGFWAAAGDGPERPWRIASMSNDWSTADALTGFRIDVRRCSGFVNNGILALRDSGSYLGRDGRGTLAVGCDELSNEKPPVCLVEFCDWVLFDFVGCSYCFKSASKSLRSFGLDEVLS